MKKNSETFFGNVPVITLEEHLLQKINDKNGRKILLDFGLCQEGKRLSDYEKRVVSSLSKNCAVESFSDVPGYEHNKEIKNERVVGFKISNEKETEWFGWGTLSDEESDMPRLRLHYIML